MEKFSIFIKYTVVFLTILATVSCSTKQTGPVNPSGEKEKTVYAISVEKSNYTIDANGGNVQVPVTHNVDVSVGISADADWVELKGSTPGNPEVFEFNVEASKVESERKCTITFSNSSYDVKTSTTITQQAYEKEQEPEIKDTFDPENIVYSFANLSDIHMSSVGDDGGKKFISALQQLQAKSKALGDDNGLDAVMISGDMTNNPGYNNFNSYESEFEAVKSAYESILNPASVPLIYTPGNHDISWSRGNVISEAQAISDIFGDDYFLTDEDKTAKTTLECRHCVIDGFHVICITPESQNPVVGYNSEALNWLDRTLASITAKEPDRYVFLLTHPMIHDTVYGSLLGPDWLNGHCSNMWYSMGLTPVLIKYPQVVTFSGHLHFPINDPRSIWQGKFTAIGCGSCRYMAIEDGEYENMSSTTVMSDAYDISTGYLTQIDFSGNIRITRMFFSKNAIFGEPWYLSHPNGSNSHLNKYNHTRLKQANGKPSLGSLTVNQEKGGSGKKLLTVCFDAATDDEFAHDYVILLKKGSSQLLKKNILADYYKYSLPSEMKKKYEVSLGAYPSGDYTVSVTATDSWGASATSTLDFSVSGSSGESTAAYVYSDINFSGNPTDVKGKASITNHGAAMGAVKVSHGGVSKTIDAMSCGSGKYATGEFSAFSSSTDFKNFAHDGFSVEAFYVDKSPGIDVHGIFCGTEKGGWGLAAKADGTPYFVVGDIRENNYIYLYAGKAASTTDLTHIVGVYDFDAGLVKLYVNGKFDKSDTIKGPFYPAINGLYNKFCLGADVAPDGVHFPCSNMIIVDAKMYRGALTDKEVSDAYQATVNMLK